MKNIILLVIPLLILILAGCAETGELQQAEQTMEREHPQNPEKIEVTEETEKDEIIFVESAEGIKEEELVKHNKEGDCWIFYEGKVYDYSNAKMHPNMAKTFYRHCGQLSGFEEGAKGRHSGSSENRVANYGEYLGELI